MPRKIVFTREEVIEAAFELFKHEGMAGVSARKIAAELNSSTAPVYNCFKNIDELKNILLENSLKLLLTYTEKGYTPDIFLNIGVGLLEFAKEYSIIYRTLFLENNSFQNIFKEFNAKNLIQMKKKKSLAVFYEAELRKILEKLTVFAHGLASFICTGMLENNSREYLINTLQDVGFDIIGATAIKRGKYEEYCKLRESEGDYHDKHHHHQRPGC